MVLEMSNFQRKSEPTRLFIRTKRPPGIIHSLHTTTGAVGASLVTLSLSDVPLAPQVLLVAATAAMHHREMSESPRWSSGQTHVGPESLRSKKKRKLAGRGHDRNIATKETSQARRGLSRRSRPAQ